MEDEIVTNIQMEVKDSFSGQQLSPSEAASDVKSDVDAEAKKGINALSISEETPPVHTEEREAALPTDCSKLHNPESEVDADMEISEIIAEKEVIEPIFDGSENPETGSGSGKTLFDQFLESDSEAKSQPWPDRAAALKNYIKERGAIAVSTVLRRLSGEKGETENGLVSAEESKDEISADEEDVSQNSKTSAEGFWNPLNLLKIAREVNFQPKLLPGTDTAQNGSAPEVAIKGRITLYTKLGCHDCHEIRELLRHKGLRPTEINMDIFPSRKTELKNTTGTDDVPKLFFNDISMGGLVDVKAMDDNGELGSKINELLNSDPPTSAPLPPFPGEDDASISGMVDEFALIVKKMKESVVVKDRLYKMRRFSSCFVGSDAADFLMEDQLLDREAAVEFGRKLAEKFFFRDVLEENTFEDGNHLYRFLEHDPVISSQCYNLPRGIIAVKPKFIAEVATRLRLLTFAICEAYVYDDGRRVDYERIRISEEFARYVRISEELQRVDLLHLSREEKLAFFINLYNMMAIHAILTWGYPEGTLDRRLFFGEFRYVIGGYPYSLSAIQNGILRGNSRPPYNLVKPFGTRDKRALVALPYPEPLAHFALVFGAKSGPCLRGFNPGDIDKELMDAARHFMKNGGLVVDPEAKVVYVNSILRWYTTDFGKIEMEMIRHCANYLDPAKTEELLELISNTQLKVVYQPFDWTLNY